ncbi:MAG: OmpA family protein [Mariprofundaceae bacterium]|nr:OmpA family protein [Mariprofundaceae bacterium]
MMRTPIHSIRVVFVLTTIFFLPAAHAATLDEAKKSIADAKQLRAAEFAPEHFADAREALADAEDMLNRRKSVESIRQSLDEAQINAQEASSISQSFSQKFHHLVESRDRMQLSDSKKFRADLAKRAEEDFSRVVEAFENGYERKARNVAKMARNTVHAAEVVAAREQISKPLGRAIAGARRVKARKYAPKALTTAAKAHSTVERIIKESPNEQTRAYSIAKRGEIQARRAMRISRLGQKFDKKSSAVESWIDAQDGRMRMLGKALNVDLNRGQTPEEQLELLKQAVQEMQQNNAAQLADADGQIRELSEKLSKYETKYKTDMAAMGEIRRKLQLKREAEAKIKRLIKLFDPANVEILLTPDANVILRLKKLNFRSGSAVIPPNTYSILDHVMESITIFNNRNVRVEGHTDSVGANLYNQDLSERRALAVQDYLRGRMEFIHVDISGVGFGEDKPIANNETAEGRERNRRIDIVLLVPSG